MEMEQNEIVDNDKSVEALVYISTSNLTADKYLYNSDWELTLRKSLL